MERVLYLLARMMIAGLQALPLPLVARLGCWGGVVTCWFDARHRRVAHKNLKMVFGREKSEAEIRALVRENFRRIGENFASAVKTAVMTPEQMRPHFQCLGAGKVRPFEPGPTPSNRVMAIGHFGNFELYVRLNEFIPMFENATTYRGLKQPVLNQLLQAVRAHSGCRFYERRSEAAALRAAMSQGGVLLGLLADQNAGRGGTRLPFFGQDCSTSTAPAVFALRYDCPLYTGICYRIGLARWRIEVGDEIPTREHGQPRAVADIMADVNRCFEVAVRRDPANWFWVHDRWKAVRWKTRSVEVAATVDTDL